MNKKIENFAINVFLHIFYPVSECTIKSDSKADNLIGYINKVFHTY